MRTHHTPTMRAFSSASAAQLTCPIRHTRYKTRPTHRKTPNLGTFSRAGRIYSRIGIKQAEQGEFIHACGSNMPSMRISLAHSVTFETWHPAPTSTPQHGGAPHRQAKPVIRPPTFTPPIRRLLMNPVATDRTGMKENTPMRELLQGAVKDYSPRHAQRHHFSTILSARGRFLFQRGVMPRTRAPCWGDISFTRTRLGQLSKSSSP